MNHEIHERHESGMGLMGHMGPMKAISLWEPWASAMALGLKENETRSWWTGWRGDVVICAAKRKMTREDEETFRLLVTPNADYEPQYGKALCVVRIFDCLPSAAFHSEAAPFQIGLTEAALGNYEVGRWVWGTVDLRRLRNPVPIVGRQGLWNLEPTIAEQIERELPEDKT